MYFEYDLALRANECDRDINDWIHYLLVVQYYVCTNDQMSHWTIQLGD